MRTLPVFLLALTLFVSAGWAQSRVIAPTGQWVTDQSNALSPAQRDALSQKLRSYADTTSTQIVVVIVPTLNGMDESSYATELGRAWGVGQQVNNGVVVLVSPEERATFIATGYGLEGAIPDAIASRIVRNVMIPQFRNGDYYAGIDQAVDALVMAARGEFSALESESDGVPFGPLLFMLILFIFVVYMAVKHGGTGNPNIGSSGRGGRRKSGPIVFGGGGSGGFGGFGGGGGGFGGGGFSGGGGSFGGGGAGGRW